MDRNLSLSDGPTTLASVVLETAQIEIEVDAIRKSRKMTLSLWVLFLVPWVLVSFFGSEMEVTGGRFAVFLVIGGVVDYFRNERKIRRLRTQMRELADWNGVSGLLSTSGDDGL